MHRNTGNKRGALLECSASIPQKYEDEEHAIELAKAGNEYATNFLIRKYQDVVYMIGRTFFLPGAEEKDLMQEGYIGLYKAIRDYDDQKEMPFSQFVSLKIRYSLVEAVRKYTQEKQLVLSTSVSFDGSAYPDGIYASCSTYNPDASNPEYIFIEHESSNKLLRIIEDIASELEKKVMSGRIAGMNNREIASYLGCDTKNIENALFRARKHCRKKFEK